MSRMPRWKRLDDRNKKQGKKSPTIAMLYKINTVVRS